MKNKIIVLLALLILFSPVVSRANTPPLMNLTTVVNTQGVDSIFHFSLSDVQDFDLQTNNLSASKKIAVVGAYGSYSLSQNKAPGLKIDTILCISDNPKDVFFYQPSGVRIAFSGLYSNIACTFNNVLAETPVLIVPGLLGTEMKNGNDKLWLDLMHNFTDIGDEFMDPLQFNSNLTPTEPTVSTDDVISAKTVGLIKFDYTEGLINEFKNQGYIEGAGADANLFTFPYDWRYGVSGEIAGGGTNVDLLAQKIQDIMTQTGSSKVDVVAHSMGGLIVKKYVMDHPADNHIGKAVFVGVPNTGAPKAVKVLVQGDNFNIWGLNDEEMKKIAENMPAAYDLLPTQKYYNVKGSFVSLVDFTAGAPIEKDLNYNEFENYLIQDKNLNNQGLINSGGLHTQSFDDFDLRTAGVDVYAIDGCKTGTMTNFVEAKYKDAFGNIATDYARVELNVGDGTVPIESATNLPIDQNNKYYALVSDHSKMPSQDGIRQEIVNLISGSALNTGSKITQDINQCKLNGKAISVFSPVDIFVTDQAGNKLGLASDGSVVNEIPGADFEIMGDHKFLYLPTDAGQIYTTNLTGTASGTFTLKSADIQNSQTTKTEVFSNLAVTPALVGQVNLVAGNATTLSLNDSPTPILPSATLDASTSEDLLPPVSIATLSGTAGQAGFYRSNVAVNIKATDDLSGVLAVNYNLDNAGYQKISGGTAVLNVPGEGGHTIAFFSTDNAGNNEQEKIITFTIDKTAPEAVIQFDSVAKDLKFTGADSSSVLVQDKDDTIILTDQAGNTTEIKLKNKSRKILMSAQIKSIKYNGVAADISKNDMAYLWLYDKSKNLKLLSQYAMSKKNYNILAVYDGKNTSLIGKDASGKISKSFSGLKILKITTNKGDLQWSY